MALGPDYAACYTDSDELLGRLNSAASKGGELLWRMPLAPEYAPSRPSPCPCPVSRACTRGDVHEHEHEHVGMYVACGH